MLGSHPSCNKTTEHIQFIGTGDRNKQLCLFHLGFGKRLTVGTVSTHTHGIIGIGNVGNDIGIVIYRHHIMPLVDKAGNDSSTDLSASDDYNSHHFPPQKKCILYYYTTSLPFFQDSFDFLSSVQSASKVQ